MGEFKFNFSYDRRSVGQSVLVSGQHLESATTFPFSPRKLSSDIYVFINTERPLWRDVGSVITCISGIGPWQCCHFRVQVPQNLRSYLTVSFETGFPFCRLLQLTGLRCKYSKPASTRDELWENQFIYFLGMTRTAWKLRLNQLPW
jgi:hypothetical protein